MKANGPADSISHSFKGILEARDTELFRLANKNTQVGRFSEEGGREGKDRGTHLVRLGKNARGTICPASLPFGNVKFRFPVREHATALFLWQRPRATSAISRRQ